MPKPWKFWYDNPQNRREVKVYSHVWLYGQGGNGHQHVDIKEEDNMVWDRRENEWCIPIWTKAESPCWEEYCHLIKGRMKLNTDFIKTKDVVKWAVSVLREWGVLGNKRYKIVWDLDEEDPLAVEILARQMRKRAERAD